VPRKTTLLHGTSFRTAQAIGSPAPLCPLDALR
jgi:hypothetical protein